MNIIEALKKAKKEGRGIARKYELPSPSIYILPTNTTERMLIVNPNTRRVETMWEPSYTDLVKTEWVVYG